MSVTSGFSEGGIQYYHYIKVAFGEYSLSLNSQCWGQDLEPPPPLVSFYHSTSSPGSSLRNISRVISCHQFGAIVLVQNLQGKSHQNLVCYQKTHDSYCFCLVSFFSLEMYSFGWKEIKNIIILWQYSILTKQHEPLGQIQVVNILG